jgi:hypothetical protein
MENKKVTISNIGNPENKGPTFEEESNEFAGEDVTVWTI